MSTGALTAIVDEVIKTSGAASIKDMGRVMKDVLAKVAAKQTAKPSVPWSKNVCQRHKDIMGRGIKSFLSGLAIIAPSWPSHLRFGCGTVMWCRF